MDLKSKALKGIKWTGASSGVSAITQILKISILARFLSPEDFGLMALASVVVGFVQVFADGGVSNAVIYKQDINKKQLSSLYWFNIIVGFILFVIILVITPIFSNFYGEKELNTIIPLVGFSILLQSFSFQFKALFEKELMFDYVGKIEILSKIVSLFSAVLFGYYGYGVYALVYSLILMVFVETVLLVFKGIKIHKPEFYFSFKEITYFIKFGLFQLGERITNYISSQLDVILIGKLLGIESVGVYSVLKQIVMRPAYIINPVITRVTFPIMSKYQNDIQKLKNLYLKTIRYVSSVNFPVYTAIIVFAPFIISILLGKDWLKFTFVFQLLAAYFMFRSIGNPVGSLLLSIGRPDIEFYWNIVMLFYIPLWIFIGSFYSLEGVALALSLSHFLLIFVDWFFLIKRFCFADFLEYHREIFIPFLISLLSGAGALLFFQMVGDLYGVILGFVVGVFIFILLSIKINREFILFFRKAV